MWDVKFLKIFWQNETSLTNLTNIDDVAQWMSTDSLTKQRYVSAIPPLTISAHQSTFVH